MSQLPPVDPQDHHQGNLHAPLILIQYGDFECPYSGAAYGAVKQVQEMLGDQLCYVFRPFPLHDIHPHALHAAQAAEVAATQNRFWTMYDLLFQNQDALSERHLINYARQSGLDEANFLDEMKLPRHRERVEQSINSGRQSGVKGTPTFFINGIFHGNREGLWDADALLEAIEQSRNA
jgi:protein-disulfide isomerase